MRHCPPRLVCLFTVLAASATCGTISVMANNETTTPPPSLPGLLSSFGGSKILLIGILDSDLTIITKDASPLVYDVPMAKLDKSKVDLYGLAPVELSSKWPALSSNANFTSSVMSQQQPLSISIKLDNEKLVFAFEFDSKNAKVSFIKTVTLSVNPPSATYQEYGIDINFGQANFISSTEQNVFFDLEIISGKSHQLFKYVYQSPDGFKPTMTQYMCKQTSSNGTEMIAFKDFNDPTCTNLDWDIQNGGFVNQNRFHLFSHDTVYIFEYTGAGGADPAGVPVTVVKLSDFFVSVTPTTTTTKFVSASTGKAGASTGTIIALVCVLLAVLVIIIAVVVWCKCNKKGPRPNELEMSQSSKGPVGQSQAQAQSSQFQKQSASAQANPSGQIPPDAKVLGSSKAKQMRSSRTPSAKNKVKQSVKAKLPKFGKQSKATSLKGTK